ncbi:hypothetical protein AAL_05065 [Moelleriella libera RCEF 2490]|uniref:Survival Motor Neuron Gemin2-binding domain-containing protein n=1 Tax=Moelleriella libera RCEF 2490 TaxID=1081109 RepID=A0A168B8M1_9HYPO|nr:hypothetical protein AAL_05065 [Moelleriella libera RCEF 2490]
MSDEQAILSHEETWDDSALIESWNEALAEYKKYHSIYIRGGSVRDLQQRDSPASAGAEEASKHSMDSQAQSAISPDNAARRAATSSGPEAPSPQTLLGTIRDDGMKRLLMSWYYAGYYTGLYEGQQQAQEVKEA